MKKIFTLALGVFLTTMLFAADRNRPSVILNSSRNFEVVIDGRVINTYGRTIMLDNMYNGRHRIQVFEVRRSVFGKQRRLVDQSAFRLRQNDLMIRITLNGQIQFKERSNGYGNRGYGNDRGFGNDRGYGRGNDRDFDNDRDFQDDRGWMNGSQDKGWNDDSDVRVKPRF